MNALDSAQNSQIRLITALFALLVLVIGVVTIFSTIRLIIRSYSPVFFWDQWQILDPLIRSHDHPGFHDLWAQHNEHRIIIQRLLAFADLFWFGARSISLLTEIVVIQFLHLGLFLYVCNRLSKITLISFLPLTGFFAYCFFSPLQMENFDWGFQVAFVLVGFAASGTILLMLLSAQVRENARRSRILFTLCIIAAVFTEMSNGNGILVWPLLLMMAYALQIGWRRTTILAVTGAAAIAAYLIGYTSPGYHSNPLETVRHPGAMLKYMLTCFGYSWDPSLPNASRWPSVSESVVFIAFVFVAFLLWECLARKRSPVYLFVAADALFCLGTAAMAAAGRMRFGYGQATVSRYQSFALVFWACVAIALFSLLTTGRSRAKLILHGALLILMIAALGRWRAISISEMERKVRLDDGWHAILAGNLSSPAIGYVYHTPSAMPAYYNYLLSHHLIPQHVPDLKTLPAKLDPHACKGYVDHSVVSDGAEVSVSGWAYDYTRRSGALRVVLVAADGTIVGSTDTGIRREDVFKADRSVKTEDAGWAAVWHLPKPGSYRAYALINTDTACPLTGSVEMK